MFRCKQSDDEYVAGLQRAMAWWDRWRWIVLALSIGGIIAIGYLVYLLFAFLSNPAFQNKPPANLDAIRCFTAFVFGISIGVMLHRGIELFGKSLLGGFKSERLLIELWQSRRLASQSEPAK